MDIAQIYRHFQSAAAITTDSRRVGLNDFFVALRGERFDGNLYAKQALEKGAAFALVDDPKIAVDDRYLLVPDSLTALQQLARMHRRQFHIPLLAITGSNGKTTTKELVGAVLGSHYRVHVTQGNLNNHIGVPLTLLEMPMETEVAVIEMGANHQREIAALCAIAEPTHGLITNVGKAHLEGFGGEEGVRIGKGELYDFLRDTDGTAFVNLDESHLPQMAERVSRRIYYCTSDRPAPTNPHFEVQLIVAQPNVRLAFLGDVGRLLEVESQLPGKHNFENLKTAIGVGKYFKVPAQKIADCIEAYRSNNNRSQRLQIRGINFYLDAYNANPTSMDAALETFAEMAKRPRAVVLGSMLELGDATESAHFQLAQKAVDQGYDTIIVVGEAFATTANNLGLPYFSTVESLNEWFWEQNWEGYQIFLKGSRSIGLDRLVLSTSQSA